MIELTEGEKEAVINEGTKTFDPWLIKELFDKGLLEVRYRLSDKGQEIRDQLLKEVEG